MTWRDTLRDAPELRDMSAWPPVDLGSLSNEQRKTYRRRKMAVEQVLAGRTIYQAAEASGLHPTSVSKVMKRCLAIDADRQLPALSYGLIPNRLLRSGSARSAPQGAGYRGQFARLLLKYPEISDEVDKVITEYLRGRADAPRPTATSVHQLVAGILRKRGVSDHEYPFSTVDQAKESIRKFFNRRWRHFVDHRAQRKRTTLSPVNTSSLEVPGVVECDHHYIDAESSVVIEYDVDVLKIMRRLRLARFWLGLAIERSSTAVLGYSFDLARQPNRISVLGAMEMIERGSGAMDLGRLCEAEPSYPVLPLDFDQSLRLIPREVRLDNAWVHYSNLLRTVVVDRWGGTLCHGLPASPLTRQLVESFFRILEQHIHRLPSTSGTSVTDPRKESKRLRRRPPEVTVQSLVRILHELIRRHNLNPRMEPSGLTPIEALKRGLSLGYVSFAEPPPGRFDRSLFERTIMRPVHLYKGLKPHINLLNTRYDGGDLLPSLKQRQINVRYDIRDVRTVNAYTLEGQSLGTLSAPKRWTLHRHSEHTRNKIYKFVRSQRRLLDDPIGKYLSSLINQSDRPDSVREIVRLAIEMGRDETLHAPPKPSANVSVPEQPRVQPLPWSAHR